MSMEPEFLVEIMEMNEEIFDAETRCDIFCSNEAVGWHHILLLIGKKIFSMPLQPIFLMS